MASNSLKIIGLPNDPLPENVPANWGKTLLQRAGMFSGGGMPRRAWEVAGDAKGWAGKLVAKLQGWLRPPFAAPEAGR
jgi:hypothetical protein